MNYEHNLNTQKENPKDEATVAITSERRDCKKLRFTIYELRLTKNPKS